MPVPARPSTSVSTSSPRRPRQPSRTTSRTSPNTNRSPVSIPAALATSSGLPVIKPRAKLAALLEGRAASCSANSIFAISAGATATPRSAARSRKLRASSTSPAASASSISRVATAALKSCRAPVRKAVPDHPPPRSCAPHECLRAADARRQREQAAAPSESVMARRVNNSVPSRAAPRLGPDCGGTAARRNCQAALRCGRSSARPTAMT